MNPLLWLLLIISVLLLGVMCASCGEPTWKSYVEGTIKSHAAMEFVEFDGYVVPDVTEGRHVVFVIARGSYPTRPVTDAPASEVVYLTLKNIPEQGETIVVPSESIAYMWTPPTPGYDKGVGRAEVTGGDAVLEVQDRRRKWLMAKVLLDIQVEIRSPEGELSEMRHVAWEEIIEFRKR